MKGPRQALDEAAVRRIVREELDSLLRRLLAVADEPRTYSTRKGEAPPGYSREAWRALAHTIGARRGRYWYVDAARLEAHERGTREPAEPP